jgi:acetylserotonin O-methyltransferase
MIPSTELPPDPVVDLMEAFRRSQVLFTAVNLRIFEILEDSARSLQELASGLLLPATALEQLLTACQALGLISRVDGSYQNTPITSQYLTQSSPCNLLGYIRFSDMAVYQLWSRLTDAVREGSNRWDQVFGGKTNFFDNIYADPTSLREFIGGMHGLGVITSPTLATAFELGRFRHLVDLGGATGHLAIAACQAWPDLKATVYDLAPICIVAQEHIGQSSVQDRVQTQTGDFFTDPLPQADLYALSRILHDWKEEKIRFLLKKCFENLPRQGGLLVCEKLLNEEKDGPVSAALQSLNMLVITEGRERTASEYKALLQDAGFGLIESRKTGKYLDAVLAIKDS